MTAYVKSVGCDPMSYNGTWSSKLLLTRQNNACIDVANRPADKARDFDEPYSIVSSIQYLSEA